MLLGEASNDHPAIAARRTADLATSGTVILAGVGNVGHRLAAELPLLGTRRLVLVDPDRVTDRNLTCCSGFTRQDLSRHKVAAVADRLQGHFQGLEVAPRSICFGELSLAELWDNSPAILVGAVDSRRARYELAEAAFLLNLPLVNLAIAGTPADVLARVQVTWWPVKQIDALNAWSTADWGALESRQACAGEAGDSSDGKPTANPISAAAATALGAAAVSKLWASDTSDVGVEIRVDLHRNTTVRCALPSSGLSPLEPAHVISGQPVACGASTLGELVSRAEALVGRNAEIVLRQDLAARFVCRQCNHELARPRIIGGQQCPDCGETLVPTERLPSLSRESLSQLAYAPVECLGEHRRLLRVLSADGSCHVWIAVNSSQGVIP